MFRRLAGVAASDGFIRFDRFMETVLYDGEVGYYARPRGTPFGGDFYTAPHLNPLFGAALASRIATEYRSLGMPRRFRVVEVGPGDGTLAHQVVDSLSSTLPPDARLEYVLVDRSAASKDRILEEFSRHPPLESVDIRWAEAIGADGPFQGVLLANELLDAMPARRLVWRDGQWDEQGVAIVGDRMTWAVHPLDGRIPGPALPSGRREGAVLEVELLAESFLREISDHLEAGCALLLDFGCSEEELLAAGVAGTLVAVHQHHVEVDPLAHPGDADLSVWVNFTRLRAAARAAGLREVFFRTQAESLGAWGIAARLSEELARTTDEISRV
ncbi:MAG: SAM-dependent methyltransferase [Thermoplasmata archaeon]|nr:SAM-dependent methyltransferase [Thermoplasmata archaeon]